MSNHDTKTAIRERMSRTGENYTTARRALQDAPPETGFMAQAVKTTAPAVIQAFRRRALIFRLWDERRAEFASRIAGDSSIYTRRDPFSNAIDMTALDGPRPTGHGRWKAGPHGRGWVPAKGNPLAPEFETLTQSPLLPIPGMPDAVFAGNWVIPFRPFEQDGTIWVYSARDPLDGLTLDHFHSRFTHPWEKVRPSDALSAAEDWNAQNAGTRRAPLKAEERATAQQCVDDLKQEQVKRQAEMRATLGI